MKTQKGFLIMPSDKNSIKKTKKDLKTVDTIVSNFCKDIHTLDDVKKSSSMFFVKKDGTIEEIKERPSVLHSELMDMMIESSVSESLKSDNEIKMIVKACFGRGSVIEKKLGDDLNKKKEEANNVINNLESCTDILEESELVKNFLIVEVFDKKFISMDMYEFISSFDKIENKVYVCISPEKEAERTALYSDNSHIPYYFKSNEAKKNK